MGLDRHQMSKDRSCRNSGERTALQVTARHLGTWSTDSHATTDGGSRTVSRFVSFRTHDVRFPTSRTLDGSDAMNPDPDYSAAYVVIGTDAGDGLEGHGFAFTIRRGNDVQGAALRALEPFVIGLAVDAPLGEVWRTLVHDSQLRWLGPEKGVMHMA